MSGDAGKHIVVELEIDTKRGIFAIKNLEMQTVAAMQKATVGTAATGSAANRTSTALYLTGKAGTNAGRKIATGAAGAAAALKATGSAGLAAGNKIAAGAAHADHEMQNMHGSANMMLAMFGAMAVAFTGQALFKAGKASAEFNNQLRETATLSPYVAQHLDLFGSQIQEMAETTGQSTTSLTKALYDTVSAGVPAADAIAFVGKAAKLAIGGVGDVADTTNVLTGILNGFGLAAGEAGRISDELFTTVKLGKTTIAELSAVVADAAAQARGLGISTTTYFAAIAEGTKILGNTNKTMTGLRGLMTQLAKPTAKMSALFNEMVPKSKRAGDATAEQVIAMHGLDGIMRKLAEATGGSSTKMTEFITEVEGSNFALTLAVGGAKNFTRTIDEMAHSTGATHESVKTITEGVKFFFDTTGAKWKVLSQQIGEELAPSFVSMAHTVVEKVIPAMEKLTPLFVSMAETTAVIFDRFAGTTDFLAGLATESDLEKLKRLNGEIKTLSTDISGLEAVIAGLSEKAAKSARAANLKNRLNILKRTLILQEHERKGAMQVLGITENQLLIDKKRLAALDKELKLHPKRAEKNAVEREALREQLTLTIKIIDETKKRNEEEKKNSAGKKKLTEQEIKDTKKLAGAKLKAAQWLDKELYRLTHTAYEVEKHELEIKFAALQKSLAGNLQVQQAYELAVAELKEKYRADGKTAQTKILKEKKAVKKDWYATEFDTAKLTEQLWKDTATSMRSHLVEQLENGKLDFDSFANFITSTFRRMVAEMVANQIMLTFGAQFMGTTGTGGTLGQQAMSAGGNYAKNAIGSLFGQGGAAAAGDYSVVGNSGMSFAQANSLTTGGTAATGSSAMAAAAVALYLATDGFGLHRKDKSPQNIYGVNDTHKNPAGGIRENSSKFRDYYNKGEIGAAGFNLTQISDTSDRFLDNIDISDDLKNKWLEVAHEAGALGAALGGATPWITEFTNGTATNTLTSAEAEIQMRSLSESAIGFATDALLAGGASGELATAAVELAVATNPAAAAAWDEMTAMQKLSDAIYKTNDATRGLAQAQQGASVAEQIINQQVGLSFEEYEKLNGIKNLLAANSKREIEINKALAASVSPENYAALMEEKKKLNAQNKEMIDTLTGLTKAGKENDAAMVGTGEGAENTGSKSATATPKVDVFIHSLDGVGKKSKESNVHLKKLWNTIAGFHDKTVTLTFNSGTEKVDGSAALGLLNTPYDGYLAQLHRGESVLSDFKGDAGLYRQLVSDGTWGAMKENGGAVAMPVAVPVATGSAPADGDIHVSIYQQPGEDSRAFSERVVSVIAEAKRDGMLDLAGEHR